MNYDKIPILYINEEEKIDYKNLINLIKKVKPNVLFVIKYEDDKEVLQNIISLKVIKRIYDCESIKCYIMNNNKYTISNPIM